MDNQSKELLKHKLLLKILSHKYIKTFLKALKNIYIFIIKPILLPSFITLFVHFLLTCMEKYYPIQFYYIASKIYALFNVIYISEDSYSQLITILTTLATSLFALIAIVSALVPRNTIKNDENMLKSFLEDLSSLFYLKQSQLSYNKISKNLYTLGLQLSSYSSLLNNFKESKEYIKKTNLIHERISDFSFCLFYFSLVVWITSLSSLQKDLTQNIIFILLFIFYLICIVNLISWNFYKRFYLPLIKISENYLTFPELNDLVNLNKVITIPNIRTSLLLPANLFANTSYFQLRQDEINQKYYISLTTLSSFIINGYVEINYMNSEKNRYKFNSEDYIQNKGIYNFEIKQEYLQKITSISVIIENEINNNIYKTYIHYKKNDDSNIFVFTNAASISKQAKIDISPLNIIKPENYKE